jgi:hypothetical protein
MMPIAKLELNHQAAEAFNNQAAQLLTALVSTPRPAGNIDPDEIGLHITAVIPEQDLQEISSSHADALGQEDARFFGDSDQLVGLAGEGFKNLVRLSEGMQRAVRPRDTVSVECLTELIFEWVRGKYQGSNLPPMTENVLAACESLIEEGEILIPISSLRIQSSFSIGRVTFVTLTRRVIDGWQAQFTSHKPELAGAVETLTTRWRKEMQGYAAAIVKVEAEPKRASQVAYEEAEKAIGILRFFSQANFHPHLVSSCAPLGALRVNRQKYFRLRGGELIEYHASSPSNDWELSDGDVSECREKGLNILSALLLKDKLTDFQGELLQALLIYSKSSTANDVAEKLIYILVAIESMFVMNKTEPLQSNIRERMAFFAGTTVEERLAIKDNVTKIYDIRSSFLHHGQHVGIDKLDAIQVFMLTAWRCLQGMVQLADGDSTTKDEMLKTLEKRKWS